MPDVNLLVSRIRILLLDVDGVMTDGRLQYIPMPDGSVTEAKTFDVNDGAAIGFAARAGIKLGILSGRSSPAVTRRAEELHFDFVYQGLGRHKLEAFHEILATSGVPAEGVCYVGDDVAVPVLRRVGFPVAVANACPEAIDAALHVTQRSGGNGAVREVVELILRAQSKWDTALAEFLHS